ncbi:MAG: DUF2924 domain-containing protein [Lentilitoribacter sp.]
MSIQTRGTKAHGASSDIIVNISNYDRVALAAQWQNLFGKCPAKNLSSAILIRIITHELQIISSGGLKNSSKRALRKKFEENNRVPNSSQKPDPNASTVLSEAKTSHPLILAPGTQLIREWNGRPYRVEVTDDGFILDGKSYRSLSAIAKKITGAHWSGPRFFGLGSSKSRKAPVAIAGATQ